MTTHILFDFFGTLVDYSTSRTEQGYERSFALLRSAGSPLDYAEFLSLWSEVSAEFDAAAARDHLEFSMHDLGRAFMELAVPAPDEEIVRDFVETYLAEWNKGVRYLEGLPAMLERLGRDFELGILTNTHDADLVPRHLDRMGVGAHFRHVITSVEFGRRKPSAELFRHALGAVGAEGRACVYVGDSYEADYLGARAVEIRALLIDPQRLAPIDPVDRLGSIFELEERSRPGPTP